MSKPKGKRKVWIEFELLQVPEEVTYKPKTKRWAVQTKPPIYQQLGIIKWCCAWRKYAFYPHPNTLFEEDCLQVIADFIKQETNTHRTTPHNQKGR